ncbi:MAG: YsnF/AvaK domain-containing protein [Burkholderiales bacterium]|nr:YsnF/AvaK domain-containing protein [Anaerolineae bacterium]
MISRVGASAEPTATIASIPVIAEELVISKQSVESGKVRIHKSVNEREEVVDEPLLQESIDVVRVEVNQLVDGPVPVRYEGDTMVISLLEEVLVVEKRLMVREEIHVVRTQTEIHAPQTVTLRSEEVSVERVTSNADQSPD